MALQLHGDNDMHVEFKNIVILDAGRIIPKRFIGVTPASVKPGPDGVLSLHAAAGHGIGPKIMYMAEWGAFGWFTDQDRVEWPVELAKAGRYDVWLEWSVADSHAGNPFLFQVGDAQLTGTVDKSGSWETYRKVKIGQMELKAGAQLAVFRANGAFKTALMDLREIRLTPAAASE